MPDPLHSPILSAAIVAIGLAAAGGLIGSGVARIRSGAPVVTVRGVAERDVTADLATWTIATQSAGSDLAAVQAKADADAAAVRAFMAGSGFAADEVANRGISVNQYLDSNSGRLNITIRQRIQVRTTRVATMVRAYANQAEMIRKGVALDSDGGGGLAYTFTRLNAVKPAMIAEATKSARAAADQFAKDSDTRVGGIKTGAQGLFSIEARAGESGSGSDTPNQKVRVVTTVEFYLQD
jgi:uncharacterized protein